MTHTSRATGTSLPRFDAADKVRGTAPYPDDIDLPEQACLHVVFAGVPHARIVDFDASRAKAAPGVLDVLTAADVPVNEYGLVTFDQPVICGLGSTEAAQTVRWEADCVAVVVAETEAQAKTAAELIDIEYEELPVVTDPVAAMQPDAPLLHPQQPSFHGHNVLHRQELRFGDVDAGFAQADVIVEGEYQTHAQEHAYLQPESGLAFVRDDGRVEVVVAGQWMHEDRQQIAHALDVAEEEVVVRYPAIGGAFGGREDMSIQIVLALAARKTGRPVKTTWSREQSILGHHKRHPFHFKAKWGATRDGQLVAAQMEVTSDAGGYAYTSAKVLGNALMACLGPYFIPNVYVDGRTVYTNNCPGGAFRGFGGPQGHFAAEMQMSKLAQALDMDPVELRARNVLRDGDLLSTNSVVPAGCTALEVLEAAAVKGGWQKDDSGWQKIKDLRLQASESSHSSIFNLSHNGIQTSLDASRSRIARGKGIAVSLKNVGFSLGFPEHCWARIELEGGVDIERATVACVGADVGQGAHQAFRQLAAEMLDLPVDKVSVRAEDTEVVGSSGSASASRMTFMAGNAIQGAVEKALREWENEERPARGEFMYVPRKTTDYAPETGESDPHITFGYCAQVAEVEVDLETGHVAVTRLVSVNDVGKAVNAQLVEGQIEGGAAQSLGWALMENLVQRDGHIRTPHLSSYLIPGVLDIGEAIEPVILEHPDPQGPLGVRGMAEMPMIPTAPAIAAALHDALGVWYDELPLTPERVWLGMRGRETTGAVGVL